MKIIYTKHAEERMIKKSIKKVWIETTIGSPDILLHNEDGSKKALKHIKQAKGTVGTVYRIENQNIIVITAYWG